MIMMRLLVGATRSMVWRSWLIADDMPIRSKRLAAAQLEVGDLALQLRGFQRALGDQDQAVGLERLLDEVVGAAADGRDGGLDVAVAGDHHHRQARMHDLDLVEQRQAVEPRALQPDVEEDQPRRAVGDRRQRAVAVVRRAGFVALVAQDARDEFADVFLVVDDENIRRHYRPFQFLFRLPGIAAGRRMSRLPAAWQDDGDHRAAPVVEIRRARRAVPARRHGPRRSS